MFPLSGAGFMVDWLPKGMQSWVLLLPMVHGVEMLREGYFGNTFRFHYSVTYFMCVNLVLLFIGLALAREAGRRVEPE
jgi:capsular polysaccharide transport system permease protein